MALIPTLNPVYDWRIIVDAYSGEILAKKDLLFRIDGEGLVFDPNPVVTANDSTFRDPTATVATCGFNGTTLATIDNERITVPLRDITQRADGKYVLEGPFVKVQNSPEESNRNNFLYSSGDIEFETVMCYYHIDTIQRYIQSLGITTAHNSQIETEPHAGTEFAYFSPLDKGLHFGHSGGCRPDRAEEGECMAHEYGHAIQADQVTDWGETNPGTGRKETRAMGEGFGDILACLFFAEHGNGFQREVFEDWIFADINGLRRVDGTKVYPTDWVGSVHSDGEIWSAALWNIYRSLGGDSNNQADRLEARNIILKTVILSHHSVLKDASMPDGAEAVMDENAELEDYRGKHLIEMLDSFHDRGILECNAGSDLRIKKLWTQIDDSSIRNYENPEYGQDNWFYAEIKNEGATEARGLVVTFSISFPFSTPVYPNSFRDDIVSATVEFDLAPGSTTTVKACWPEDLIPPEGSHGCVFCEVYNPVDHVPTGTTTIGDGNGKITYRNTNIVDALPNDTLDYYFEISNYHQIKEEITRLEVIRPPKWEKLEISIHHHNQRLIKELWQIIEVLEAKKIVRPIEEIMGLRRTKLRILEPTRIAIRYKNEPELILKLARDSSILVPDKLTQDVAVSEMVARDFVRCDAELKEVKNEAYLRLRSGHQTGFPYMMKPRDRTRINMKVVVPQEAKPGDQFAIEVIQRNIKGDVIGGFDIQVNVVEKPSRYLGNNNTMEIHDLDKQTKNCQIDEILEEHKVWFNTFDDVKADIRHEGYNGCAWCMPELHTD